ncbi:MAG TPA: azurin [Chitinophagaceae bacterium]|nr:azurin [Chitinophagaceae bacterium]HMZ46438.1 azurin [Chitinophagaceae bacterium]HNE94007.1 azurin [Chitinophagaceae bacterium]HNM35213.1 azurin [Chitinophagaceae bacterium]HNN30539.1 azurin [Chitinophagaceae bacterium]
MKKSIVVLASITFLLTACSNSGSETKTEATTEATTEAATEAPAEETPGEAPAATDGTVTLTGGDDMKFDLSEIKVKDGQTVKLTLVHSGKMPKTAMGHNFVLLATGVDVAKFATDAINAKDNDYIPASHKKDIIAHTKTIGGGESTTIEFKAPAKGTYDFLCSFPGHSAMMKGKFIVE